MPRALAVLAAVAVSLWRPVRPSAAVRATASVQSASGGTRLAVKVARKGA